MNGLRVTFISDQVLGALNMFGHFNSHGLNLIVSLDSKRLHLNKSNSVVYKVDGFSKSFWPYCEERTRARASLEHAKTNSLISLAAVVMRGIFPIFVSTSPLSIIFYIYSMTQ